MTHATTSDFPGWPTPPRVRDIPNREGSWGWFSVTVDTPAVAQDELGRLWADGDTIPRYERLVEAHAHPGGYLYWTEQGLGLYLHPKSYSLLANISSLDMRPDQWIPVAVVAQEVPGFAGEIVLTDPPGRITR